MLTTLKFQPGVNRETTSYASEGGWFDCNRIRFRAGTPETIGGWTALSNSTFLGVCRKLTSWSALDGTDFVGVGTHLKYYIVRGSDYNDITPLRVTTAAGDVTFAATNGLSTITVTDTGHGAIQGDYVTFSGAVSLGGNVTAAVLNAEHTVTEVLTADTYTITVSVTANASDTGNGGASVVGAYQINIGLETSAYGNGWGAGPWGGGGWGDPADLSIAGAKLRLWSNTAYGEDLVINPRGGGVYLWDRTNGLSVRAQNIATLPGENKAPRVANCVLLSEQDRHLIVFGTDDEFTPGVLDPLLIRFSATEDYLDWETRANNTAGSLRLSSGTEIITAVATKQVILVLTDSSAHTMQFLGPPYTFGLGEAAYGITVASPNAAVATGDDVYWMGRGEFYRFNGVVMPIPCAVKSYVFDNINNARWDKVCAGHNSAFGEIWWFYCAAGSEENDRYVVFNYQQNLWYYGAMERTAWLDKDMLSLPIAAAPDHKIYYHETGVADGESNPPVALGSYVESSAVDLADGEQFMFIRRLLPDVAFTRSTGAVTPTMTFTLKMRNFSGGSVVGSNDRLVSQTATTPIEEFTEQVFLRLRGRAMVLRAESNCSCTAWRLGAQRIDVRPDGKK
jgi:hypothetical protein